jgi:hypothetical protein
MVKQKVFLLLGILCIFTLSFCFKSPKDCQQIRNGQFYYFTQKSREKINVYRKDSLQLEIGSKTNDIPSKNKVIWKNTCEYDMYMNALSDSLLNGDDSILAATPAHVKIIHIDTSFYVCIATLTVFDKSIELRDTLYFAK